MAKQVPPGLYAILLPNGNLLRAAAPKEQPTKIGGAGGILEELDWNSNVVWSYRMLSENEIQHHCFDRMPNGNTLVLGWERKTPAEFQAKGRKPGTWPKEAKIKGQVVRDFWVDFVREVDRDGQNCLGMARLGPYRHRPGPAGHQLRLAHARGPRLRQL